MIPDLPNLSNPAMPAAFKQPYDRTKTDLSDYARGGVNLLDSSRGINVKNWFCELSEGNCVLSAEGVAPVTVHTLDAKTSWISVAFDQNMHYNLAYRIESASYLYWYDAASQSYVTTALGNVKTPFIRMDDSRDYTEGINDIVLSYMRSSNLCVRIQRDRFTREYVLATNAGSIITQCGMNQILRFQWYTA